MTTDAPVGINVGCAVVRPSLADVAVGYGPYFGTVLVAVRCSLACAATKLAGSFAAGERKGKCHDE
jgi:hypothetical protein